MIKFEIQNKKTGKKESYSKEQITLGEAERCYEWMENREKETSKNKPDLKKIRNMEYEFVVSLFKDQGLTIEDILEYMSTKTYARVLNEIFQEINGTDDEVTEDEGVQEGKNEEQSQ